MIFILIIDLINMTRKCIRIDLMCYLFYDFRYKSQEEYMDHIIHIFNYKLLIKNAQDIEDRSEAVQYA